MASTKDTFEVKTFAANSFACGTFRGSGVDPVTPEPAEYFTVRSNNTFEAVRTNNTFETVRTNDTFERVRS